MQLFAAVQTHRHRHEVLHQLCDGLAQRHRGAGLVDHDRGVQAVASGAPFVLAHQPRAWRGQRVAAVEQRVEALHQTLPQRCDHTDLAQRRNPVADAQLDGAEAGMRPDVPPDLPDAADAARGNQRVHEPLELCPAGQLPRRAGRRQTLEHLRATGRETGVMTHPVRTGGAEGKEVWNVCRQRVDHRDCLLPAAHAHVHVDAEDLHLSRRPLHLVHEALIPRIGADHLRRRVAERMRS